jgi:hypothetical protein
MYWWAPFVRSTRSSIPNRQRPHPLHPGSVLRRFSLALVAVGIYGVLSMRWNGAPGNRHPPRAGTRRGRAPDDGRRRGLMLAGTLGAAESAPLCPRAPCAPWHFCLRPRRLCAAGCAAALLLLIAALAG